MSEEEKKAIEYIDNYIEKFRIVDNSKAYKKENIWNYFKFKDYKALDIVLNYIDKLQEKNQVLEKIIDLIIDDFQIENYFVNMTNKEVREYYKKRKELKE